ncbi:MAG: phosphatase PAP2 family protein [Candidatus Eisenbacteria bacterium]
MGKPELQPPCEAEPAGRPLAKRRLADRGWYPADLVVLGYLVITGLFVLLAPLPWAAKEEYATLHFLFLLVVLLLHYVPRSASRPLHFFRHIYAFLSLPFLYKAIPEINRITSPGYFDDWVARYESLIFGCQPSQIFYSAVPWVVLSEFLHLTYMFYLVLVPIVSLTLYFSKRFDAVEEFTTTVMATFLFCYAIFSIFPVRGPFYYFGPIDPSMKGVLFPQLTHDMLTRGAAVGTAFPSSHVAVAVAIWLAARRHLRRLSHVLMVVAASIFVGTVYGGFHYALDAVAGLAVGILFGWLGPRLHSWLRGLIGPTLPAPGAIILTPRARFSQRPGR